MASTSQQMGFTPTTPARSLGGSTAPVRAGSFPLDVHSASAGAFSPALFGPSSVAFSHHAVVPPPGLVNYGTSGTPAFRSVEIDEKAGRMKRMRRSVLTTARMVQFELGPRRFKPAMLTLTYRDVDGWQRCHISDLLQRIRHWLARRGHAFPYVWVAELQQRGALHYHVLLWLPRGLTLPKPDKQGWWPHGHTRIEWARNAVGYLVKYVSKFDSDAQLPKGARLHGGGGLDQFGRQVRRWFNLPAWLKPFAGIGDQYVRIQRVGLVERSTGVCVQSPWRVSFSGGRLVATELFRYVGGILDIAGPYSRLDAPRGAAC
ncbi:rolling circle replication-associated protein [Thiomonas sp.]